MQIQKTRFAVLFGNRGFFPASLQPAARDEMLGALAALGHDALVMDADATPHGAVETAEDGSKFAGFLEAHRGQFGGVIVCLPNFGDETGAIAAVKDAAVPILIQAYPDEIDKLSPKLRRDAFCGKFSVMDVFSQYGVPFTAMQPHVVHPSTETFAEHVRYFDRVCRVHGGLKNTVVGAIGARTTAFKTVRIDELALQKHGITTETLDLSDVFARVDSLGMDNKDVARWADELRRASGCDGVPTKAFENLAKLGAVLDALIVEYRMDCLAVRCWTEVQRQLGVSPCVLLGLLNDRGVAAACEVDVGNAITMRALSLAAGEPPVCMDWNNNYGDEPDKCILFHCGSVAPSLMTSRGTLAGHAILENAVGQGCSFGCNQGRVQPMPFTYGSMMTTDGCLRFYLGEGRITEDPIPADFFGCAGVAAIDDLQAKLQTIGYLGHRHHVSLARGHVMEPASEAMEKYLGYEEVVRL
jgi:L-fucose isomerase-like protein